MTPKEVVQKGYDCFSTGDMATFKTLFSDSATIKNNGMHKFSGTYHGAEDFINNLLVHIPSHFVNFKVETVQMISEGNHVFSMLHATADGMDADFGHFFKVENEKITEFHIFDDSQKLASIMKAM